MNGVDPAYTKGFTVTFLQVCHPFISPPSGFLPFYGSALLRLHLSQGQPWSMTPPPFMSNTQLSCAILHCELKWLQCQTPNRISPLLLSLSQSNHSSDLNGLVHFEHLYCSLTVSPGTPLPRLSISLFLATDSSWNMPLDSPPPHTFESTAPTPRSEASVCNTKGLSKSGHFSTGSPHSNDFHTLHSTGPP